MLSTKWGISKIALNYYYSKDDCKELEKEIFINLHKTVLEGFDAVKKLVGEYIKKHWKEEDGNC